MRTNRENVLVRCLNLEQTIEFVIEVYKLGWSWAGDCDRNRDPETETRKILRTSRLPIYLHMPVKKEGGKKITYSEGIPYIDTETHGVTIFSPQRFLREVKHA